MKRGLTIVELLIVCTLFFGLMTLVAMFLVRGKRLAVKTEVLGRVQHQASVLARKLSRDLNRGTRTEWEWADGSLIFLSSAPVNSSDPPIEFEAGTGRILWKKWVAYYLNPDTNQVLKYESPLETPTADPATAPRVWLTEDLPGLPPSQGRPVAREILSFFPSRPAGPNLIMFEIRAFGEVPLGNMGEAQKRVEVGISTLVRVEAVSP